MRTSLTTTYIFLMALSLYSCNSNSPTEGNADISLNSTYQNKNIHWTILKVSGNPPNYMQTYISQPDSNITNVVYDTVLSSLFSTNSLSGDQNGPICDSLSHTMILCPDPSSIEFLDSSLDLSKYASLSVFFVADSEIQSAKITISKPQKGGLHYTNQNPAMLVDSNIVTQSFNLLKGSNNFRIHLTGKPAPKPGSGIRISFTAIDSINYPSYLNYSKNIPINHFRALLTK